MIEIYTERLSTALWAGYAHSFWGHTWHENDEYRPIVEQLFAQIMGWA